MDTKSAIRVEVKDADKGQVEAVFATFNVIDKDGDVTLPGAFEDGAPVRISAYQHTSWSGALPVGKGVIRQTDTEAILEGQFFLNTTGGRDTFEVVKQLGDQQEWSYGYDTLESSFGMQEDRNVQFLKKMKAHEVSPVLLGAGVGTRTLSAKNASTFNEQVVETMVVVNALLDSADRVVALRAEKGKELSQVNRASLDELRKGLERLTALLGSEPTEDSVKELQALYLRHISREQRIPQGVSA